MNEYLEKFFVNITKSQFYLKGIIPLLTNEDLVRNHLGKQKILLLEIIGVSSIAELNTDISELKIKITRLDSDYKLNNKNSFHLAILVDYDEKNFNQICNKTYSLNNYERMLVIQLAQDFEKLQKDMKKFDFSLKPLVIQSTKNIIELLLISFAKNIKTESNKPIKCDFSTPAQANDLVKKIIKILNEKITSTVNLDYIANQLFFSKTYIKYIFKKHKGTSIIQYYNRLKIDEAIRYISQNKYSFREVSERLGFSSVQYFNRLFKSTTGTTPTDYLKNILSR